MKIVQFSISTQFNCQKHFHFKLFKQLYVINQLSVNTVLMSKKKVLFEIIQLSISTQFKCKYGLIVKNVSISIYSVYSIHFSISMLLVLFNPLIGPYQVLPLRARVDLGAMAMKGVLRIPQSSSTPGTLPSDCLVSYPGHSLGGGLTPLQRCSQCILQPQLTGQREIYVCTTTWWWWYITS